MLQNLPLEILTHIADFVSNDDVEEFSATCQACYFAILPHIWKHLSIHDTTKLKLLAKRLKSSDIWTQRANQFVRDFSFCNDHDDRKLSPAVAASMFGIAGLPTDPILEHKQHRKEHINSFAKRLLNMFPHLANLDFDFTMVESSFDTNAINYKYTKLSYSGSVSLINYKSDNTRLMRYILSPFKTSHHLKLKGSPVLSLCDNIDESILTNNDITDLGSLGLIHLQKLELSYLDNNINLDTLRQLIQNLPNLIELDLEWMFPPNQNLFSDLCQAFKRLRSLNVDKQCTTNSNIFHVHFIRQE